MRGWRSVSFYVGTALVPLWRNRYLRLYAVVFELNIAAIISDEIRSALKSLRILLSAHGGNIAALSPYVSPYATGW